MTAQEGYTPRTWPTTPTTLSQWGGGAPPLKFLLTGFPVCQPAE
jgi:hypothetical protein